MLDSSDLCFCERLRLLSNMLIEFERLTKGDFSLLSELIYLTAEQLDSCADSLLSDVD